MDGAGETRGETRGERRGDRRLNPKRDAKDDEIGPASDSCTPGDWAPVRFDMATQDWCGNGAGADGLVGALRDLSAEPDRRRNLEVACFWPLTAVLDGLDGALRLNSPDTLSSNRCRTHSLSECESSKSRILRKIPSKDRVGLGAMGNRSSVVCDDLCASSIAHSGSRRFARDEEEHGAGPGDGGREPAGEPCKEVRGEEAKGEVRGDAWGDASGDANVEALVKESLARRCATRSGISLGSSAAGGTSRLSVSAAGGVDPFTACAVVVVGVAPGQSMGQGVGGAPHALSIVSPPGAAV